MNFCRLPAILFTCASAAVACSQLGESVGVDITGQTWDYTLANKEPQGSPNYVFNFLLLLDSQVGGDLQSVNAPAGWTYLTDYSTFVEWTSVGDYPYPNDLAPGMSLGGFDLTTGATLSEITSYTLSSWDHAANVGGPDGGGLILTPLASQSPVGGPAASFVFAGPFVRFIRRCKNRAIAH